MKKLKSVLTAIVSVALLLPLAKIVNLPHKIIANIPFVKDKTSSSGENCVHGCNGL